MPNILLLNPDALRRTDLDGEMTDRTFSVTERNSWEEVLRDCVLMPPQLVILHSEFLEGSQSAAVPSRGAHAPTMDGRALADAIRLVSPTTRVLGCTGVPIPAEGQEDPSGSFQLLVHESLPTGQLIPIIRRILAEVDSAPSALPVGVVRTLRGGAVCFWNAFAERFFALERDQVSGPDLRDMLGIAGYSAIPLGEISSQTPWQNGDGVGFYFRIPLPSPPSGHLWIFARRDGMVDREQTVLRAILAACADFGKESARPVSDVRPPSRSDSGSGLGTKGRTPWLT